jgi:RNase adapter protein RapZ
VDDSLLDARVEDVPADPADVVADGFAGGNGGARSGAATRIARTEATRIQDGAQAATTVKSRTETDLVIVTGVSGGGRSTVARALENVGFYVVDNLPQVLLLDMAELAFQAGGAAKHTAMVLDVRSRAFTIDLTGAVRALRERGFSPRVLFVDADDDVLIRRFEGVRRSHPLQGDGRLADGIAAERALLVEARESADVIIDTSHLNVNQLRSRVEELFGGEDARRLRVTVLSFGFKYGLPPDADFVVDARFLPNPFWVPELRDLTGRDEPVSQYVLGQRGAGPFVDTFVRLINATVTGFEREGKRYLTVAVGCTGGKHRSVAIAEEMASRLRKGRLAASAQHRDLGRE